MNRGDNKFILEAAHYDINTITEWFNTIGIEYSNIEIITNGYIIYKVKEESLMLADLSSGERLLLYLLACKNKGENGILVRSLFERLGSRLTKVVKNNLFSYNGLVVVYYNRCPLEAQQFIVKEI